MALISETDGKSVRLPASGPVPKLLLSGLSPPRRPCPTFGSKNALGAFVLSTEGMVADVLTGCGTGCAGKSWIFLWE